MTGTLGFLDDGIGRPQVSKRLGRLPCIAFLLGIPEQLTNPPVRLTPCLGRRDGRLGRGESPGHTGPSAEHAAAGDKTARAENRPAQ